MLISNYSEIFQEAGVDEAGRGCLAGPVVAAAVILPRGYRNDVLNDSKNTSVKTRLALREIILKDAISWKVAFIENQLIDEVNILNATYLAMHKAIEGLHPQPELLLIDGNRFKPYRNTPHQCIIKGDGKYASIAAASILAKTFRDDHMEKLHLQYPQYHWNTNKGYATKKHIEGLDKNGFSPYHRRSFHLRRQLKFPF